MTEIVDPLTGATPEWEAFIASLDPVDVERERFGQPSRAERPGSAGWRAMLAEHDAQHARFYGRRRCAMREEIELALVESREWDRRHERNLTPQQLQIAISAIHNAEGHAA